MVLHFETETDDYSTMSPVPIERYEQLLNTEALYDRAIDELTSDIRITNRTYMFKHEVLMMLGAIREAKASKEREEQYEDDLGETVSKELQGLQEPRY